MTTEISELNNELAEKEARRRRREEEDKLWAPYIKVMVGLSHQTFALRPSQISINPRRVGGRPIDETHVAQLAESIRVRGGVLEIPIRVNAYRNYNLPSIEKVELIDGAHRLAAWKRVMGDAFIQCIGPSKGFSPKHLHGDDSAANLKRYIALRNKLAALEHNHCRLELDPLTRAKTAVQIAELMQELATLARPPGAEGAATEDVSKDLLPTVGNKSAGEAPRPRGRPRKSTSARAVAAKMGVSRQTAARDLKRAKNLGETLDKVAGTSLAAGNELDALAALPEAERNALVERAAAGEAVTARKVEEPAPNLPDDLADRQALRTFRAWRADHGGRPKLAGRQAVLQEIEDALDPEVVS